MKSKRTGSRGAFTLVEVLCVAAIVAIISGGIFLGVRAVASDDVAVVRSEADALALWITARMSRAQAEGRVFTVTVSEWKTGHMELRLRWSGGLGREEVYRSERAKLWVETGPRRYDYSSAWHTMTPAVVFSVRSISSQDKKNLITVSGQGFVSVSPVL